MRLVNEPLVSKWSF